MSRAGKIRRREAKLERHRAFLESLNRGVIGSARDLRHGAVYSMLSNGQLIRAETGSVPTLRKSDGPPPGKESI
jgi:hypothetical protein